MNGPYDDYFESLGLPENWHESKEAKTVTRANYLEQESQFQETENELKWEWFCEIEEETQVTSEALGYFVAHIDIKACQTKEATKWIQER